MVELFNLLYFLFIGGAALFIFIFYSIFKNKSSRVQYWVVFTLLFFNLCLHFQKAFFPPYSLNPDIAARDLWFINICAVSVLSFPFFYLSKSEALKDFMFFLGVISGFLALVYPTEALDTELSLDVWRFYICHTIIFSGPLLMVLFKIHIPDYKRIYKIPFIMAAVLLFIMVQQVIQSELGFVSLRNSDDFFNFNYRNTSLIWGPGKEPVANIFKIFTPQFLTRVPFGEHLGEDKYWPFFWLLPSIFFFFTTLPFLILLPWQGKTMVNDLKTAFKRFKFKPLEESSN